MMINHQLWFEMFETTSEAQKKKERNDTLKMYSMHRGTMPRDSLSLGGPKILLKNKEKENQTNYTERHVMNLYEKNNEIRTCTFFLTPSVGQLQQKRVKYQVKNNKNENNAPYLTIGETTTIVAVQHMIYQWQPDL